MTDDGLFCARNVEHLIYISDDNIVKSNDIFQAVDKWVNKEHLCDIVKVQEKSTSTQVVA